MADVDVEVEVATAPPPSTRWVLVSVKMRPWMVEELDSVARRMGLTRSELVRLAVERLLGELRGGER